MSDESTEDAGDSISKRRWFRFSLRTLLAALVICCVSLGWWIHGARQQRMAVERIAKLGGFAHYDYEIGAKGRFRKNPSPPGPSWLRDSLDINLYCSVKRVRLQTSNVTDSDLQILGKLTELTHLSVWGHQITDLSPMQRLSQLEFLNIMSKRITGKDIEKLQRALPNCHIHHETSDAPGIF